MRGDCLGTLFLGFPEHSEPDLLRVVAVDPLGASSLRHGLAWVQDPSSGLAIRSNDLDQAFVHRDGARLTVLGHPTILGNDVGDWCRGLGSLVNPVEVEILPPQ